MADTEYGQLLKIQQSGGLNPTQQTRLNELQSQGQTATTTDGGASAGATGLNSTDVIKNAQGFNQFYQQANQPAIQSYEASKAPLQQRYSDLIKSIKTNQGIAENRQTVTTQNELGRRGIFTDSGVGQQELTNALNPVTSEYTQRATDTTNQENIDLANIQNAIASLQVGNPSGALSSAMNLSGAQETSRQNAIDNALKQQAATQPNTAVVEAGGRKLLINQITGETIKDLGAATTSGGATDFSSLFNLLGMGGANNQDVLSKTIDDYVKKYGIDAAEAQGIIGPKVYGG